MKYPLHPNTISFQIHHNMISIHLNNHRIKIKCVLILNSFVHINGNQMIGILFHFIPITCDTMKIESSNQL